MIILTADESKQAARLADGLATPDQWAHCTSPRLSQISDGAIGYAVFTVSR